MNKKNISLITNFGCPEKCWYCIWEHHPLKNTCLDLAKDKFEKFLIENKELGKFSVSGGGDCLYKFNEHLDFWDFIFYLKQKHNMLLDIHSRTKYYNDSFWKNINKLVISSDTLIDCRDYINYIKTLCKVRITHVVTDKTTIEKAAEYIEYCDQNKLQLTFKQLSLYNDNGMYKLLKEKFKERFYLDSGDYNIYFMPNNLISDKFI